MDPEESNIVPTNAKVETPIPQNTTPKHFSKKILIIVGLFLLITVIALFSLHFMAKKDQITNSDSSKFYSDLKGKLQETIK